MRPQGAAKDIGRIYAVMHPSVCGIRRIHLPLQGRLCRRLPLKKAPLQGELSPQVTEGCIAAQDQMVSFCIGTDPSCGGRSPAFLIRGRRPHLNFSFFRVSSAVSRGVTRF